MIKLPEDYEKRIKLMFGEGGEQWLKNVPNILDKYINKFNIKKVTVSKKLTFNIILFARCEEFGDIVMKIGLPYNELLEREIIALTEFYGKGACKCYYSDLNDGIIILERLIPGETLNTIDSRELRIKTFYEAASVISKPVYKAIKLPTYREILNRSIKLAAENSEKFGPLKKLLEIASELYNEIEINNPQKYLLHADLHHDNILTTKKEAKAIDPHGFIGERVMETARFIENEIQKEEISKENIIYIIKTLSNYYKEKEQTICKALFIDYVLSTCWDTELNFDGNHINNDINNIRLIYDCLLNDFKPEDKDNKLILKI